ncbi:AAA family ATPase [Oxalobacteraceae bacterium A2-2]
MSIALTRMDGSLAAPERDNTPPKFSAAQARALAGALCDAAGVRPDPELSPYLEQVFAALDHVAGGLAVVLDAHVRPLAEVLERDAHDAQLHTLPDRCALLLNAAHARLADPSAKPWLDLGALLEAKKRAGTGAAERSDTEKEYARFLARITDTPLVRPRQRPPEPARLLRLAERYPNFARPLQFLAEQAAYATLSQTPFQPPPLLLLNGPAGCGKTSFAAALAGLLGSRHEVLNMAAQSCGFTIGGMDRGWSSARPGMVFEALQHGPGMAPVIPLDAIDKASAEGRSSPYGPLYTLLEPGSARAFRDEYAGIPVDASQVLWLATANDSGALPAPLLSRFKVFDIAVPGPNDLLRIAESMLAEVGAGLPQAPRQPPPAGHGRVMASSVRELRMGLHEALGRAAQRAVAAGDTAVHLQDHDLAPAQARAPVGFC